MNHPPHLAIAGATGAVGIEMLHCLQQRNFPISKLTLLASARSVGKMIKFRDQHIAIKELTEHSFHDVDIALFSAGGGPSKEFVPHAVKSGTIVVDNSSAFRMDPDVPLVVPEINGNDTHRHNGIIANPNCTTIISFMALAPLHEKFGLIRIIASSYQAVSGAGASAMRELEEQIADISSGTPPKPHIFSRQIAFNVIPQVDSFTDNGYTKEEMKLTNEGRKILNHPALLASITCVRVPVYRSHSIAITAQFAEPITPDAARHILRHAPGVRVVDDPSSGSFPTPLDATHGDDCLVGRLRQDISMDNTLTLWVVGDQIRKGAALNAVQIAEQLLETP